MDVSPANTLPTTAELNLLCQWNRGVARIVTTRCTGGTINTGIGASGSGFVGDVYWSSSESSSTLTQYQTFSNGYQNDSAKFGTNYVRPVRAF